MRLATAAALVAAALATAGAASAAEPFAGQTIYFSSSTDPGGGFDVYVRLLARHIGRHIAGNPTVVPQNRPGGGGLVLANHLYNAAAKDGTQVGLIPAYVLLEERWNNPQAKFDPTKFVWIGNMNREVDHCSVWHTTGITRPEDFFDREVILGASGVSGGSYTMPILMNEELGTKFRPILGFESNANRTLSMERGEIMGQCGTYLSSIKNSSIHEVEAGRLKIIWQMGLEKHPDFPNVPLAIEYAKTDEARQMLEMFFASATVGRAFAVPPGVPEERIAALRAGFDATMTDPAFIAESERTKIEVRPASAKEMEPALHKLLGASPEVVAKAAAILENARNRGKKQEQELKAKSAPGGR
ncbi:MAG: Bug family tripartite tricarboxylate transporter substrate binding protein [Gemmatimonas sp.]